MTANFTGKLRQNYKVLQCKNFQDTFETHKRSFISAHLIYRTVPLKSLSLKLFEDSK